MKYSREALINARRDLFERVANITQHGAYLSSFNVETGRYHNWEELQLQWEGFNLGLDAVAGMLTGDI